MKRQNMRFTPDENTVVWFCLGHDSFNEDYVGLAVSEAYGGAGIVIVQDLGLKTGDKVTVKIGELAQLKSEIRWVKELGDGIFQIGIQHLE